MPAQIVEPGAAAILTDGVTLGVTVIVMVLLVAVSEVTQAKLEVITTEIWSPFARAAFVYVALFAPTFTPFFFH